MDWKDWSNYFVNPPSGLAAELFKEAKTPFEPLERLQPMIEDFFVGKKPLGNLRAVKQRYRTPYGSEESSIFMKETMLLKKDYLDPRARIFIAKGVMLEAGSTIKNHTIILEGCEIRQGAYLRGNLLIGPKCVIGHTTETKNSIFVEHVEAGHFAYIGDSILGRNINLGAGTKISNLEFRSLAQKEGGQFPEMKMKFGGEVFPSGKNKFGAILGDGLEAGCNSVISPLCFLMKESWILPNLSVPKGVYPPKSILKSLANCKSLQL